MRTLQEKYNAIQEGKFSKEHFLAEARMQQPQLITRFNGYDDAVQILKNRGMIQEVAKVVSKNFKGLKYEIQYEAPKGYKVVGVGELEKAIGSPKFYKTSEEAKERAESDIKDYLGEKETVKEAKLTKKSLTDYRYKPTNDMDKYPYEQILRGLRVELEDLGVHATPTAEEYSKALAKVSKNLAKDSIFYTNQVAGVNPKVDQHDQMIAATAKNTVDTFNGMKKAALKEGFKKLIKKVLSENSNSLESLYEENPYGSDKEYEFYSNPENYNEEEEEFELQGDEEADDIPHPRGYEEASDEEDEIDYDDENFSDPFIDGDLEESRMGDVHILAQESDTLKDFLIAVKQQHPEVDIRRDIEELQNIWNSREEQDMMETKKSLSELLK